MVAKKTAVQQSASGRSTGPAVKDVGGKKSASVAPVAHAADPMNTVTRTATKPVTKTATKAAVGKKAAATGEAATTKEPPRRRSPRNPSPRNPWPRMR